MNDGGLKRMSTAAKRLVFIPLALLLFLAGALAAMLALPRLIETLLAGLNPGSHDE